MKKLLILIIATAALASCNNIAKRNEKIKTAIANYVANDLDKAKLEKVDSVQLISIDTLTDKGSFILEFNSVTDTETLFQMSEVVEHRVDLHNSFIQYEQRYIKAHPNDKSNAETLTGMQKHYELMRPDSIKLAEINTQLANARSKANSLAKAAATADDTKFTGYLVKAAYTIRTPNGTSEQQHNYLVSTECKVAQF